MTLSQRTKPPFTDEPAEEIARPRRRLRTIGELLHERREDLGLDLASIGEALRIKPSYLAALEQSRAEDLPGPTYAIGFVRSYANHLGLDADLVLDRYKAESAGLNAVPDLALPVPLGERSLPGAAILLVALIVALCGYGTWYFLSTGDHTRPERVAAVPPALQLQTSGGSLGQAAAPSAKDPASLAGQAASGTSGSLVSSSAVAAAPSAPSIGTATPPIPQQPPTEAARPPQPTQKSATAQPPPPPAGVQQIAATEAQTAAAASTEAGASAGGRVTIKAAADCWIQVRAGDQSIVFSRVLKAGESYRVPAKSGLSLRTGNAGALDIAVDGKPAPSIGGVGMLRRNIALDPDALLNGTAVHG